MAVFVPMKPAQAKPMEFILEGTGGNCAGCEWIRAEGEITNETPEVFKKFVAEELHGQPGGEVVLNSPGGNLIAGIRLGAILRAGGYVTSVGSSIPDGSGHRERSRGECLSACAFSFLGGVSRSARDGEVGIHQFYSEKGQVDPTAKAFTAGDLSMNQVLSGLIVDHIVRMGADPRVALRGALTPANQMYRLSAQELVDLRVAWDPFVFLPWTIEPYGQGIVAVSKRADEKVTATFFCRRDRRARLMLSYKLEANPPPTNGLDILSGALVMGFVVPRQAMSWTRRDSFDQWEMTIADFDLARANTTGEFTIDVREYAPRVAFGLNTKLSSAGLKPNVAAALRNCL